MFKWLLGWQPTILVLGIAVATATVVGGYGGYKIAAWQCAAGKTELLQEYNTALRTALTDYAQQARAEQARAVLAAIEREKRATSAQEVIRETTSDPGDAACEWRPSQLRRLERLYETHRRSTGRAAD